MPRYLTDSQRIAELVKQAILTGELKPAQRLPQRRLALQHGTTTIVVREALRRLENEGLVAIEPKWGAIVAEVNQDTIRGRYIVREALEGMAARLASQSFSGADRTELLDLADRCDRDLHDEGINPAEKAKLHYALHAKIVRITACGELISLIEKINLQMIIVQNAYHIDWTQERRSWHRSLVEAILSKDMEQAESAMREHVRRGYEMEH
jgi:DNA-binding GntR family transcriptional regulator